MKCFVLLALVAFASANSFGFNRPNWSRSIFDQQIQRQQYGDLLRQSGRNLGGLTRFGFEDVSRQTGKRTIAQELVDAIGQLIQQSQLGNALQDTSEIALQVSEGVKLQILEAKKAKISEAIVELQREQGTTDQWSFGLKEVRTTGVIQAIELLKEELQRTEQEKVTDEDTLFEELKDTLQVVIEAQVIAESVGRRVDVSQLIDITDEKPTVFLSKIQKLVIQFVIQDIQKDITDVQPSILQLQQQQQLVTDLRQKIKIQVVAGRDDIDFVQRLRRVEEELARKEQYLVAKQVALSLIAEKLQEAGSEAESQLQKQTVIEQAEKESIVGGSGRLML